MTVEELIEQLQKMPGNAEVVACFDSGIGETLIDEVIQHEGYVYLNRPQSLMIKTK